MNHQLQERKFIFQKELTIARAESAINRLGWDQSPSNPIQLDLSACRHVDLGAGWLLGNALRRYAKSHIKVLVPPPGDFSGWWFLNFTRSGLGFSLARYASQILSTTGDITASVRKYYLHGKTKYLKDLDLANQLWSGQNFCLVADLHDGNLRPNNENEFDDLFRKLCTCVSLDIQLYGNLGYNDVVRVVFEATQNVYDHAKRKPYPPESPMLSYLSLRYYETIKAKTWGGDLTRYLDRVHTSGRRSGFFKGWVEIVVNDDGVGVAARQSQDEGVYWTEGEKELLSLVEALRTGGSIKLRTQELARKDPGYGLSNIAESLQKINAFALLRTGRRSIYFDSSSDDGFFKVSDEELGYMPGTALQIIFPRKISEA